MTRLEQNARTRDENAKYLTGLLGEIPGIVPVKMYEGCTRNAWHLYMLRYQAEQFGPLPRAKFLQALNAEGIPSGGGYTPVPWETFLKESFGTRGARRVFSQKVLGRVARALPGPRARKAVQRSGLVHAEHALGPARRHGPDRRGHPQDPRSRGGAGQGVNDRHPS